MPPMASSETCSMASVNESPWKKTRKELPPPNVDVLGIKNNRYVIAQRAVYDDGREIWVINGSSGGPITGPTYWMLIPK